MANMDGWERLADLLTWIKENYDIDTNAKGQTMYIDQNADVGSFYVCGKCGTVNNPNCEKGDCE